MRIFISSPERKLEAIKAVSDLKDGEGWAVQLYQPKDAASLEQNALQHVWFKQVADDIRAPGDKHYVKAFSKLKLGVPILKKDDFEFLSMYQSVFEQIGYDSKIKAMYYFPISSIMSKRQKTEYLHDIYAYWTGVGFFLKDM